MQVYLIHLFFTHIIIVKGLLSEDNRKIAFLFLSRGALPLEDIWREFFTWRANPRQYTIYVHLSSDYKFPSTSFFRGKETTHRTKVKWGGMSQVRAMKDLVRDALSDPLNHWFCLMSESCIPLHPFPKWRRIMLAQSKSVINACFYDPKDTEVESRWRPSLEKVGLVKSQWRKSANWFALVRKHAEVFVNETVMEVGWETVPCCDEHYLPTTLAYHNLDNETTCNDGFVHAHFSSPMAAHPVVHGGDDVTPDMFAYFSRPLGKIGFGMMCTGFDGLCHFTARKFSPMSKYALLHNIDLILSEDDHPYTGDPWTHFNALLRFIPGLNGTRKYYLIEQTHLREIPSSANGSFLSLMHLNRMAATNLTDQDRRDFTFGAPFVSHSDGLLLKSPRKKNIYLIRDGFRHLFESFESFTKNGYKISDVRIISEHEIEQIPLGQIIK